MPEVMRQPLGADQGSICVTKLGLLKRASGGFDLSATERVLTAIRYGRISS